MKRALVFLAVAGIIGIIAAPAAAADSGWHLRVFAAGFDPDLDVVVPAENPEEIRHMMRHLIRIGRAPPRLDVTRLN